MIEPKPCPFCGTNPVWFKTPWKVTIGCPNAKCDFTVELVKDIDKLVDMWNRLEVRK